MKTRAKFFDRSQGVIIVVHGSWKKRVARFDKFVLVLPKESAFVRACSVVK